MARSRRFRVDPQHISSQRARQGLISFRMIWVLVIGTALAAAAVFGMWILVSSGSRGSHANPVTPARAAQFHQ